MRHPDDVYSHRLSSTHVNGHILLINLLCGFAASNITIRHYSGDHNNDK